MATLIGDELARLNQEIKRSLEHLQGRYQVLLRDLSLSRSATAAALPPVVEGLQRVTAAAAALEARTKAYEQQLAQGLRR